MLTTHYNFMKKLWLPTIFIFINLLFLLVILWSLMIYTSLFKGLPWYEPCGMQFLAIFIISDPAIFVIGLIFMLINKYYPISKGHRLLPFIALAGLSLPILIDGSLSKNTLLIGTLIGIVVSILIVYVTLINLFRQNTLQR